jgi:hypothetical protein
MVHCDRGNEVVGHCHLHLQGEALDCAVQAVGACHPMTVSREQEQVVADTMTAGDTNAMTDTVRDRADCVLADERNVEGEGEGHRG